jgi:hypothetical protein
MNYLMRGFGVILATLGVFMLSLLAFDPETTSTQSNILGVAFLAAAMALWKFAPGKW